MRWLIITEEHSNILLSILFFVFVRADNSMIIDEIIEKFDKKIVQIFPIFIPIGDRNYSYVLKFVELLLQLKL